MSVGEASELISIIVLCSASTDEEVHDTLESIAEQGCQSEIAMVGLGGSNAFAAVQAEMAQSHPHLLWSHRSDDTDGVTQALNRVRGDVVGIQTAGDVYLPGSFRLAIDALTGDHSRKIVYGDVCGMGADGMLLPQQKTTPAFSLARYLARVARIHQSGTLFRRQLAHDIGGWPAESAVPQLEFWLRMVFHAVPLKLGVPLAAVRSRADAFIDQCDDPARAYARVLRDLDELQTGPRQLRVAAHVGLYVSSLGRNRRRSPLGRGARALLIGIAGAPSHCAARRRRSPQRGAGADRHRSTNADPQSGWDVAGIGSHSTAVSLPANAETELSGDSPRLRELEARYSSLGPPLCEHSFWASEYRSRDLNLPHFRGDNAFVWQLRNMPVQTELRYSLYLRYLASIDTRSLLETLSEDGLFGCWTFDVPGFPTVSRDLLDSINEMYFIDRVWGLFDRTGFSVLDIGAGYGRLAHRMTAAVPGLDRFYCADGVPESTFLCEYYLGYRRCDRATVVAADELNARLPVGEIGLAVNIHSFSEMSHRAIAAWLDQLVRLRVPRLMVVPNDPDEFLSYESDHSRREFQTLLRARGYELRHREPTIRPRHLSRLIDARDNFYFFEHREFTDGETA